MSLSIALLFMVLVLPILKLGGIIDWPWWSTFIPAYLVSMAVVVFSVCRIGQKDVE